MPLSWQHVSSRWLDRARPCDCAAAPIRRSSARRQDRDPRTGTRRLASEATHYNLFIVDRIWQETEHHEVGSAIQAAVPRAGRAISIAALALAASFATLWIIPIAPLRMFSFAVCIGVLVDAFVVRTLMIPALLAACGDASWWPSRRQVGPILQRRAAEAHGRAGVD